MHRDLCLHLQDNYCIRHGLCFLLVNISVSINNKIIITVLLFFDRELPNKILLHSTFIYENEGYFQCVWEAENREILLQYINKIVGGEYQTDCYGIDPFTAIS
ncbi:hypothetical protein UB38_09795 [Photobacterium iliopiscarium]|nr:hypothetical protein UB38_09795 [Photobacterium iliopiscarium]